MKTIIYVITALVFADVLLVAYTMMADTHSVRVTRRRRSLRTDRRRSAIAEMLAIPFMERLARPAAERVVSAIGDRTPANVLAATDVQLERAGRPFGLSAEGYITMRAMVAVAGIGTAWWLWAGPMAGSAYRLPIAAFVVIVALLLPVAMIHKATEARHVAIRKSLPDVIDLLVVSVEAGSGLDGALAEVIERKKGPLVEEFDRLLGEIRVGKSRRKAWEDMAERVDEDNLSALVASLVQAEEVGVSIGKALRAQAETVRVGRSLQVREMAATLPVKMLFPLVLFIFPALLVVVLGPGLMAITNVLGFLTGD